MRVSVAGSRVCAAVLAGVLLSALPGTAIAARAQDIVNASNEDFEKVVNETFAQALSNDAAIDALERAASEFRIKKAKFNNGELKLGGLYDILYGQVANTQGAELMGRWAARYPQSPAPDMLLAFSKLWIAYGRQSYAVTTARQWQDATIDEDLVGVIVARMTSHKDVDGQDPFWYVVMARAQMVSERDDVAFKAIIAEGLKRNPGFLPLYDVAAEYFLPKWHGSSALLEAAAGELLANVPEEFRSAGYARMYLRAFRLHYGVAQLRKSHIDWAVFKSGAARLLDVYGNAGMWANIAMMACAAGDHEETRRVMALKPLPLELDGAFRGRDFDTCESWAATPSWLYGIRSAVQGTWEAVRALVYAKTGILLPDFP